uniref:Uncharacterized protein n=1 Tax=Setaria italica TaxID=4555 RepID=K3YNM2_SETIT
MGAAPVLMVPSGIAHQGRTGPASQASPTLGACILSRSRCSPRALRSSRT